MRWAGAADLPEIERRLADVSDWTMFPLDNLANHGMGGDHPRSMSFLLDGDAMLPISREGMIFPLPDGPLPPSLLEALRGRAVKGILGRQQAVDDVRATLGLNAAPEMMSDAEPHMALPLDRLAVPDGPGHLVPVQQADQPTVLAWRSDFNETLIGEDSETALRRASDALEAWWLRDSHRVLVDGDTHLALTGFNAVNESTVQVGGVYTPPALRGHGLARRAVALHLSEARVTGATRAILSAGSAAATRAYRSLGFEEIGRWRIVLFREPQVVP